MKKDPRDFLTRDYMIVAVTEDPSDKPKMVRYLPDISQRQARQVFRSLLGKGEIHLFVRCIDETGQILDPEWDKPVPMPLEHQEGAPGLQVRKEEAEKEKES